MNGTSWVVFIPPRLRSFNTTVLDDIGESDFFVVLGGDINSLI